MNAVPKPKRGQRTWTDAQRTEQAQKLRARKIWLKSTGPATIEGKAASARNATKHAYYSQDYKHMRLYLRLQKTYLETLRFMLKNDLFDDSDDTADSAEICEKSSQNVQNIVFLKSQNELIDQHDKNTNTVFINGLSDRVKICYPIGLYPSNRLSNVTDHPKNDILTAADILAYLKSNPDFLTKNPEALDVLTLPKQKNDRKIADFQKYMIERLKADKTEAIETAKEIVETARHNMNNQNRIHRSVLRLLEAETFEEFIESITSDLTTFLDVDITSLVIESDDGKIPHVTLPGIRIVPAGTLDKWMAGKNILHQSDISGVETVYGAGAQLVRSQVLVRVDVSQKTPPAIIAFGSRDPNMFQPGQGTEQVSFLAGVVERCIRSWLHLSI